MSGPWRRRTDCCAAYMHANCSEWPAENSS